MSSLLRIVVIVALAAAPVAALSQTEAPMLDFQEGPGTFAISGDLAEIELGSNYLFLDESGTRELLELTQNPVGGAEVATAMPASQDSGWFVIFEWDPVGYVPDSEKDSLDPEGLLSSIQEGTEQGNEMRRERGWPEFHVVGWYEQPHYDERTNNLTWAIIGESEGGRSINRVIKLLGRRGVMTATLVASPEELASIGSDVDGLLAGYRFQPGSTYAEYMPGSDKLAEIGLGALIVGERARCWSSRACSPGSGS